FQWNGSQGVKVGSVGGTTNAFNVGNLAQGTNYYFYVQATNASNSASSAWVTATTLAPGLTPPGNVQAQVGGHNAIKLTWTDGPREGGYRVYQAVNGQSVLITTLTANTTSFQVSGLLPGQSYQFFVQSFTPTTTANSPWVTATTTGSAMTSIINLTAT